MTFSAMAAAILMTLSPSFWTHWGDGKAEINTYEVVQSRYGEERPARVAHIYVTEPFNTKKQVKSDRSSGSGVVPVLKQNRVKMYQTGVYEYSLMTSVFVPLTDYPIHKSSGEAAGQASAGTPIKVTFSSQEWCGMTFHQLNNRSEGYESQSNSYFEAESDRREILKKNDQTLLADALFIRVRELIRPLDEGNYTLYPTMEFGRLFHVDPQPLNASVNKRSGTYSFSGKKHNVTLWSIKAGEKLWEYTVGQDDVRRVFAYKHSEGGTVIERGALQKSERMPYWGLNNNSDESQLRKLDLEPVGP